MSFPEVEVLVDLQEVPTEPLEVFRWLNTYERFLGDELDRLSFHLIIKTPSEGIS